MHVHAFNDILSKGILLVYDSMVNEPLHGPLKDSYLLQSNFKEIAEQVRRFQPINKHCLIVNKILCANHYAFVTAFIRDLITLQETRGSRLYVSMDS
jgi:hypothetical protein